MRISIGLMLTLSVVPLTSGQASEIKRLEGMLIAPCCYTQTIRDHMSDVAEQMRQEVTEFVLEGKTEQDILSHYKAKYGEAILAVPDGLDGQLAFGIPLVFFLVSGSILYFLLVKFTKRRTQATACFEMPLSDREWKSIRARIHEELGE